MIIDIPLARSVLALKFSRPDKPAPRKIVADYRNPLAVEICMVQIADGGRYYAALVSQQAAVFIKNAMLQSTTELSKVSLLFDDKESAFSFAVDKFQNVKPLINYESEEMA